MKSTSMLLHRIIFVPLQFNVVHSYEIVSNEERCHYPFKVTQVPLQLSPPSYLLTTASLHKSEQQKIEKTLIYGENQSNTIYPNILTIHSQRQSKHQPRKRTLCTTTVNCIPGTNKRTLSNNLFNRIQFWGLPFPFHNPPTKSIDRWIK